MKTIWIEIQCDNCGIADYYLPPYVNSKKVARGNGWIITSDDKHYCSKECYKRRNK